MWHAFVCVCVCLDSVMVCGTTRRLRCQISSRSWKRKLTRRKWVVEISQLAKTNLYADWSFSLFKPPPLLYSVDYQKETQQEVRRVNIQICIVLKYVHFVYIFQGSNSFLCVFVPLSSNFCHMNLCHFFFAFTFCILERWSQRSVRVRRWDDSETRPLWPGSRGSDSWSERGCYRPKLLS